MEIKVSVALVLRRPLSLACRCHPMASFDSLYKDLFPNKVTFAGTGANTSCGFMGTEFSPKGPLGLDLPRAARLPPRADLRTSWAGACATGSNGFSPPKTGVRRGGTGLHCPQKTTVSAGSEDVSKHSASRENPLRKAKLPRRDLSVRSEPWRRTHSFLPDNCATCLAGGIRCYDQLFRGTEKKKKKKGSPLEGGFLAFHLNSIMNNLYKGFIGAQRSTINVP